MRVYDVHNDGYSHFMSFVDERFQFVGCPEARRRGEETGYVIPERTVIRVLLYSHDLYGVVSIGNNAGKYLFFKFGITANFFFLLRHTDVTFVNQ